MASILDFQKPTPGGILGGLLSIEGASRQARSITRAGREARFRGLRQEMLYDLHAQMQKETGAATAEEEERQARLTASRAVAVAAAGGYAQDISHIVADIHGEGAYRASVALREAEYAAMQSRFAGDEARREGEEIYQASKRQARGARLSGLGSVLSMF